jgi:hypothetical protein
MHNIDLGIFLYVVDNIAALIKEHVPRHSAVFATINEALQASPRCENFSIPYCKGQYLQGHSLVQAWEHRCVAQVLPFALYQSTKHPEMNRAMVDIACK